MPVTQKDVAAQAGVTRSVVSHVMHGSGDTIRVHPDTAARVRKVAEEMGYYPNAAARNFRRQKTMQIGLLHGDGFPMLKLDSGSRYFASLMDGIIQGSFNNGYTLGLCPDLFGQTPESAMADGRFDGFIWYSTFPSERNEARLKLCSAPIVIIHSTAAAFGNRFPTVICDNYQGIRLALEHLAGLGHRRVSFAFDRDFLHGEGAIRRDAFLEIGNDMGLELALVDVRAPDDGFRTPARSVSGLSLYFESRPKETALIAHGEFYAVEAMEAAKTNGLRVPEDFSVVGFDSTSYCDCTCPALTAISQPLLAMGELAVDLLVQWIDGKKPVPIEHMLPCGFDVRQSTGPARG